MYIAFNMDIVANGGAGAGAGVETVVDVESTETGQTVTPWSAKSVDGFDYIKLIKQFGATAITGDVIKRIHKLTRMHVHRFLRRGLFFSERDLTSLLDAYEIGKPIYIYTGRGPSNGMHLGHCVPFEFTKYLQEAFGAILIIQMSDDEKYYFRKDIKKTPEYFSKLARSNAIDIISMGFNINKTYIFKNSEEICNNVPLMKNAMLMCGSAKGCDIEAIFGLTTSNSGGTKQSNTVGQIMWPVFQSIPAFSSSFKKIFKDDVKDRHCLVPMAIDQDPYFRLTRDFAHSNRKLGYLKPSCIHSEFLPGLLGKHNKMSSSDDAPTIYLTDTVTEIRDKIKKYAFSGGGETLELHEKFGANLHVDISYQYLLYFMEDDRELERIAQLYKSGKMKTSEIKSIMTECVIEYINGINANRILVTDEIIDRFFSSDREFDDTIPIREPVELYSDEIYEKMGTGYDRYFSE